LFAALQANGPVEVPVDGHSFVTSIGVETVLEANWPLISAMVDGVVVSSLDATAEAIRQLAKYNHLVVEGAGAAALAAARHPFFADKRVTVVLSGGSIDHATLASLLTAGGFEAHG
jgi:threonine dehydratase